jgi:glycosyltransferase involved in cell wall biosynthesis
MSNIKLSILIPTIPERNLSLIDLLNTFNQQKTDEVEVIICGNTQMNIGQKRNWLLNKAKGDYIVYIDDDDHISNDYIPKIFDAMGADCIGISGFITTNGANKIQWHISKEFGRWYEENGCYYRTPNHISPVKREIALQVGFPEISFGEDRIYSEGILPLLKTENKVEGNIYHYDYIQK